MAENNLHTFTQKPEDPTRLSSRILSALEELRRAFHTQRVEALRWNDHYVAVSLEVEVDLPTRGPVDGVDIREKEPIFLLLHRKYYPHKAPLVYSDRLDFPKERLPHLNPTSPGHPANFCLHRGSLDNWFAEHTIVDLVGRVRGWLKDAARDRLVRREDGFEPTRAENTLGYAIYDPAVIMRTVEGRWTEGSGGGSAFLWYELLKNPKEDPLIGGDTWAVRLYGTQAPADLDLALKLSERVNELYREGPELRNGLERMMFGVLAWAPASAVRREYFAELPESFGEFRSWAESLGIPLGSALEGYSLKGLQLFGGVPVTLVVPRPQPIIGTGSHLELLNFVVSAADERWSKNGEWDSESPVWRMGHRAPLTLERAREISSQPRHLDLGRLLFLGCGAIGSKVVLHSARSGQGNMTLVDYDELSPHNLVRHGLLADGLGVGKAEGLKSVIEAMYYADKDVEVEILRRSALDVLVDEDKEILDRHSWLIDATASPVVLNALAGAELPATLSVCRCEIADEGRLGLMGVEGPKRNPRVDDLRMMVFDAAIEHGDVSRWLRSNREERNEVIGSALEEINIGISCSSETMRLSDEVVSTHAAAFARGFRAYAKGDNRGAAGGLQIGWCDDKDSEITTTVQRIEVPPLTAHASLNDPAWQVRLGAGLMEEMRTLLRKAAPDETGGVLIGAFNHKQKIVYITRVLPEPPDSEGTPYAFTRGIQDVPEVVRAVEDATGGMLGYVGEWHTHPSGDQHLSDTDREAVRNLKRTLDTVSLPTLVAVVTDEGFHPHIFAPEGIAP